MKQLAIITLMALLFMVMVPVTAQTITMSNPGGISERDIAVYYPNGTLYGLYNSTSTITTDANESYIFTMIPISANPLEDPADWLTDTVFPFVQTNVLALLVIFILLAIWAGRR